MNNNNGKESIKHNIHPSYNGYKTVFKRVFY